MERPRLEDTGRGLTVHAEGRYLYSNRNPSGRPERIAASSPIEERCIYFVPSPLLGYGLGILSQRIPESSIILAVEISQELMGLCAPGMDPSLSVDSRLKILRLSDRGSLHRILKDLGPWKYRRVQRVDLAAGASLDEALYSDLERFLSEDLMVYWKNRHALGRLGRDWIRHSLANLATAASGGQDILIPKENSVSGAIAVIGAGPSLEQSFSFLSANRDRLFLLATDTAVTALTDNGISPDGIVALETQAWNLLDFHGLSESGIPVYSDLTSYPPSLGCTGGPVWMFSSDFADLDYLERLDEADLRLNTIPPLGSVGLAALELALRLGNGPVFLTGLDFAYVPGKSHARGTSMHRWQTSNIRRIDPVPYWEASMRRPRLHMKNAAGEKIGTDAVLASYAAALADRYSENDRIFVLAPGGLDLGLPVISHPEASGLAASSGNGKPVPPAAEARRISAGNAQIFLAGEKSRLLAVIKAWNSYAEGSGDVEAVASALEGMDEVFCDFPDEPPLPRNDDSFLVRAVSRCRKLLRYLERSGG